MDCPPTKWPLTCGEVTVSRGSTVITIQPPVTQWLVHPIYNSQSLEFESHLDFTIFSELSGV